MSHTQQSPFLGLSNELLFMVTSHLDSPDVIHLIQTSQHLRVLLESSLYKPPLHSVQHVIAISNIYAFSRFISHGLIVDNHEFDNYPLLAHLAFESTWAILEMATMLSRQS
jgi:hypothetical protein